MFFLVLGFPATIHVIDPERATTVESPEQLL